ncbi:MAG: GNAT family N-acetyltransferase [bacterium]
MSNLQFENVLDNKLIEMVEELAKEIWSEHYTEIIGEAQVKYMVDKFQSQSAINQQIQQGLIYYLIKYKDNYIGYFAVEIKNKELFLSKLYIKAEYQNQGLGKQSFDFIEELAKEKKLMLISLNVNKNNINSIKAYKKYGFIIVNEIIQDIGNNFVMDDYAMQKII